MKVSSKKSKGRRLQQRVRNDLRLIGKNHGLVDADILSTPMSVAGVDTQFSPAALKVFPLDIESKNTEKLNVVGVFQTHFEKYRASDRIKLLVHSRNRTEPMVTLRWEDFLKLVEVWVREKELETEDKN